MSISLSNSSITLVFLKATCHVNPGAKRNFAGSNSYISKHIFLKFSKTTATNNVSLLRYSKSLQILFAFFA